MHSNVESKCAGYQTVAKNNYIVDLQKKVHCGRVKRWVSEGGNAGKFVYDGPCECHVKGSHPNSAASQEVVTKPCAMVQCQAGWTLAGADERGCGGTCEKPRSNTFVALGGGKNTRGRCTTCENVFTKPVTTNAIRVQNDKETRSFQIAEIVCKDANGNIVKASGARSDYWHWRRRKTGWAPLVIDGDVKYSNQQHTEFKQDLTVWFPTEVTLASCTLHQRGQNVAHNRENWHWEAFNGAYTDETCSKTHPSVDWAHATVPDLAVAGCAYTCDQGWEGNNCDIDSSKVVRAPNAFYAIPNGFNNQGRCTTCPSRFAPVTTNAIRIKNDKAYKSRGSTFTVSEVDCKDANGNTIQAAGARTDQRPDWRNRKTTVAEKLINGNTKYSGANYAQAYDWINVFFSSQVTVASCTLHQRGQNVAHNQDDWHWEAFNGNFVDSA